MTRPDRITPRDGAGITVAALDSAAALRALGAEWQALAERDPLAGLFLRPDWLIPALQDRPDRWLILTAREDDGTLAGLLPLWRMVFRNRRTGAIRIELMAAGRMVWSEYCGFVCAPGAEARVLPALARSLQGFDWETLTLPYLDQADRPDIFAAAFDAQDYAVDWPPMTINDGATDSLLCPRLDLPGSFEAYLSGCLSARTRQKMRRLVRRHVDSGDLHIAETTPATFEPDLEAALRLWQARWAPGRDDTVERYRGLFRGARTRGLLTFPVLRRGDRMLGALLNISDPATGYQLFKLAARDETRLDLPIGLLLHAHAIRAAIGRGYRVYDFGHGDEPYKYRLGARDLITRSLRIRRQPGLAQP